MPLEREETGLPQQGCLSCLLWHCCITKTTVNIFCIYAGLLNPSPPPHKAERSSRPGEHLFDEPKRILSTRHLLRLREWGHFQCIYYKYEGKKGAQTLLLLSLYLLSLNMNEHLMSTTKAYLNSW